MHSEQVRSELTKLIAWWKTQQKNKKNAFVTAVQFHQRFEKIHPFTDGNGRVGRLILIWMLQENNYGVLLIKKQNRQRYMNSLSEADDGREKNGYGLLHKRIKKHIIHFQR